MHVKHLEVFQMKYLRCICGYAILIIITVTSVGVSDLPV